MAKLYAKAPDGSDALLSIVITGFTQSLQQNGWCKLPNGLLFQWRQDPGNWPLKYTIWVAGGICNTRRYQESQWLGSNESMSLTNYSASADNGGGHVYSSYGYAIAVGV